MNTVSQPKVFEFAKEIGMETLALMDKIREWKLPVRSHMAELDVDTQDQIRARLQEESGPKSDKAKKPAVKRAVKKAAATDGSIEKPMNKKPLPKKAVAKKVEEPEADAKPGVVASKKVVVKRAGANKVKKAEDEIESTIEAKEATHAEPELIAPVASVSHAAAAPVAHAAVHAAAHVSEAIPHQQTHVVAPAAEAPANVAAASPASAPTVSEDDKKTIGTTAAVAPAIAPPGAPVVARKREVVMTGSGPVSGVKSEAPRRNIVGRMDLSRVTPPPSANTGGYQGQGGRPPMGGGPGGPRPMGGPGGQRSLRTGFVAAAQPVPFDDPNDAESRKRFEEKAARKRTGPAGTGPGAGPAAKEREPELQAFSSTEFRKREMVFQPKKKKGMLNREAKRTELTTPKASKRVVKVNQTMKVGDLAAAMGVKAGQITKALMTNGVMATMNTDLDFDTISLIVPEFHFEAENVHQSVDALIEAATVNQKSEGASQLRSPVITVMGHVDHGKTSLLDAIRRSDVAAGEAGGITQHIGAYRVTTEDGHVLTFLDTPGHEAFTAMRARGANATDIVVVVVAADDGVMPQTAEAINHAKAAKVPIIVAINKMDRPGANPDRIKQQMTEFELVPEEWGGSTIFAPVSALKKTGIKELLEQLYLVAEMEDLKAHPENPAVGVVIESRVDKGRGPVATLLVQDGTLKVGQSIVVGTVAGRVRSLINDKGERITEAGPSIPVEVLGLSETAQAGDSFNVTESDDDAERIAQARKQEALAKTTSTGKASLEDIFSKMLNKELKELNIVLKTDVAGSVEAIKGMFEKLGTSEVKLKIIHSAVGGINESDVLLATTSKGLIVGFNVRPDGGAQALAKERGIDIKTYTVVYELMDDMKKAMSGMLTPDIVEKQLGRAEVRETFQVPKIGTIAGCSVVDGKMTRNAQVRLVRDGKIIYTGKLTSLKRFKDDAKEVAAGFECGMGIENYNDVKVGDVIEAFMQESIAREI